MEELTSKVAAGVEVGGSAAGAVVVVARVVRVVLRVAAATAARAILVTGVLSLVLQ